MRRYGVRSGSRGAALLLALAVIGTSVALEASRDQLWPRRFAEVEGGLLYRSGQVAPRLIEDLLREKRIRKVVWMLDYQQAKRSHRAERAAIDRLGIECRNLHLRGDGTGEVSHYAEALAEIHEAHQRGEAVLVQCASGSRRSGGVVALYLLLVRGRPPRVAYRELDRFGRTPVEDSPLLEFLNLHMAELAAQLVERGVIARVPRPLPLLRPPQRGSVWRPLRALLLAPRGHLAP
jgi:hypothetical protein